MSLVKVHYRYKGEKRLSSRWYVQFRDAQGVRRRLPAFTDRKASESLDRCLQNLVTCKLSNQLLPPDLVKWLNGLPPELHQKLVDWQLVDGHLSTRKTLQQHLEDWKSFLSAKENTPRYVGMKISRAQKVIDGCRFIYPSDVAGGKVAEYLSGLRKPDNGISAQTYNHYLQAIKQFLKWMVREGRAVSNPLDHLQGLNTRTDRRHDHRPLSVEEIPHLLTAAAQGPTIRGLSGEQRALLYRLAIETGARASELLSLKREDFRLDAAPPYVRLQAGYTKSRRTDTIPMKESTAAILRDVLAGIKKGEFLFGGIRAERVRLAEAIKADLETARTKWIEQAEDDKEKQKREDSDFLAFKDSAGRYADFHGLRHTTGSLLAAAGTHPSVAKEIMRHSDIRLTMNIYTHTYGGPLAEAVNKIPDFETKREKTSKRDGTAG